MADCQAGCGTELHPALVRAGIAVHPACAGPMPRPAHATATAAPVPSESCDVLGCKDGPVAYYEGQGTYDASHARMMIPRREWEAHRVPEPEPG